MPKLPQNSPVINQLQPPAKPTTITTTTTAMKYAKFKAIYLVK